jgi:hypothetical protein
MGKGEWGLVTGEADFLTIRVATRARIIEISRRRLLEGLAADAGLSSAVLGELLRRRDVLRAADGAAARSSQSTGPSLCRPPCPD